MDSINRTSLKQRIAYVIDTGNAAQAGSKDINKYVKELRKLAGEKVAGDINDFMSDTGGGI